VLAREIERISFLANKKFMYQNYTEDKMEISRRLYVGVTFLFCIAIFISATNGFCQIQLYGKAVEVNVKTEWTDSGINVSVGDTVFMHGFGAYSGVTSGDGWEDMSAGGLSRHRRSLLTLPNFPESTIIARIAESDTLIASGSRWFISEFNGKLFFTINDWKGFYFDNRGTVIVLVNVLKKKGTTSVTDVHNSPTEFQLTQNYPNPFNPSTTIEYIVENSGRVRLEIYNTLGQIVRTLVDEEKSIGKYSVTWDGKTDNNNQVPSGTYFYHIKAGKFISDKKMLLLK
jgi:hypothetical protein